MSPIDLNATIKKLEVFSRREKKPLHLVLLGGLALQHYGMENRSTIDLDAEVDGDLESLFLFLKTQGIPSDLSENISGWSVVAMPPGYRERAITRFKSEFLEVCVLDPCDFVISKLRRFTEEDIQDALFVVKKYAIQTDQVSRYAEAALEHSIKDTTLFLFKKNVDLFLKKIEKES
ncbi:MAG: hypothetical protein GXO96_11990 [Nitrospirae bacterium]|nr:hypothetical protein [Candidatus Manganitrophaceae bacterium]